MCVELLRRGGTRHRLFFVCQATVPTLVILMTTMSCSKPDMPQPVVGIVELLFPDRVTDGADRQMVQRGEGKAKVQREQPKTSTSPKGVSREASKKVSTPPRLDAQREQQAFQEFLEWRRRQKATSTSVSLDAQREQQLFQEFLKWRRRQTDQPELRLIRQR